MKTSAGSKPTKPTQATPSTWSRTPCSSTPKSTAWWVSRVKCAAALTATSYTPTSTSTWSSLKRWGSCHSQGGWGGGGHCLMGIKGAVRRSTDGDFIHANVDIDLIITEEMGLIPFPGGMGWGEGTAWWVSRAQCGAAPTATSYTPTSTSTWSSLKRWGSCYSQGGWGGERALPDGHQGHSAAQHWRRLHTRQGQHRPDHHWRGGAHAIPRGDGVGRGHCLMGIKGTVRRSTDSDFIHTNVDIDLIITEEVGLMLFPGGMGWGRALPDGYQGHSAAQHRQRLHTRQRRHRPDHHWRGGAHAIPRGDGVGRGHCLMGIKGTVRRSTDSDFIHTNVDIDLIITEEVGLMPFPGGMGWGRALPDGYQGRSAAQHWRRLHTRQRRHRPDHHWRGGAHAIPRGDGVGRGHCLMGIKGTVRRSTDGDFIHANVDIDLIITEEVGLMLFPGGMGWGEGTAWWVSRAQCGAALTATSYTPTSTSTWSSLKRWGSCYSQGGWGGERALPDGYQGHSAAQHWRRLHTRQRRHRPDHHWRGGAHAIPRGDGVGRGHCLMGIKGTVRRSTDSDFIHTNVDIDLIITEEVGLMLFPGGMGWGRALPDGYQGHSAAQHRQRLHTRQRRHRPDHHWRGGAHAIPRGDGVGRGHCLMGIKGTVRRSTDSDFIHTNVDIDLIITEEVGLMPFPGGMGWGRALPDGYQGRSAAQHWRRLHTRQRRHRPDDHWRGGAHAIPRGDGVGRGHCLMGIKGTVRRSTDGDFIHANVDIDLIITEEVGLMLFPGGMGWGEGTAWWVSRAQCGAALTATSYTPTSTSTWSSLKRWGSCYSQGGWGGERALPDGYQGHSAAQHWRRLHTRQRRHRPDHHWRGGAHAIPRGDGVWRGHCLMGIKGTVRRSTDGDFIHANVDIDLIITEEVGLMLFPGGMGWVEGTAWWVSRVQCAAALTATSYTPTSTSTWSSLKRWGSCHEGEGEGCGGLEWILTPSLLGTCWEWETCCERDLYTGTPQHWFTQALTN